MDQVGVPRWFTGLFFLYGGCVHFALFRWFVWNSHPRGEIVDFADSYAINVAVFVFPALCVAWLMTRLARRAFQVRPGKASSIVLTGSLYGVLATFVGLEVFYLFCAIALSVSDLHGQGLVVLLFGVQLSFVEMSGYGVVMLFRALPIAVGYGCLGGMFIQKVRQRFFGSADPP